MTSISSSLVASQQVAEIIRRDPHAPRYHFLAPEGVLAMPFDPNGALFWKGRYHLFYIFQDPSLPHGGQCWGHASCTDLLHWTYHPTALAPAPGDPECGIISGNAFLNLEGVPTISYHGCEAGTCIATAQDDELLTWRKHPANPVIPVPRNGDLAGRVYNVFDPHVWVENGRYYAILGGRVKPYDLRDTTYLFTSNDLARWEYVRPFYNANPHWTGEEEDCACPDFFKLGDRHVLLCISHPCGARFYLGQYHNGTFIPEEHHRMNWPGGPCFAPESLEDDRGRRIFWTWALDQRQGEGRVITQELGVMTLPRVLSLDAAGQPLIDPVEELVQLRRQPQVCRDLTVDDAAETVLNGFAGDVLELAIEASLPAGGAFGLVVRRSPDAAEQTVITIDAGEQTITIDTTSSTLNHNIFQRHPIVYWHGDAQQDVRIQRAPFALAAGEPLRLRVFLDKSMLEVFANRRQCVTQRLYPSRPDSTGLALFSRGGATQVRTLTAWPLASPYA